MPRMAKRAQPKDPETAAKRSGLTRRKYDRAEAVDAICEALSNGRTIKSACEVMGLSKRTLTDWRAESPEIEARIQRAKLDACHVIADECIEIADTCAEDKVAVSKAKLRIWTRTQLIARWSPEYAERRVLAGDPEAPLLQQLTDAELDAKLAAAMARASK
jgi:transposase-like protein